MARDPGAGVRWATYGLLLCLPYTVAGVNLFAYLAALLSLFSRQFWASGRALLRNPVVLTVLFLFGLMCLGLLYTSGPMDEAFKVLNRYKKLLLIPLLMPHFQRPQHRVLALQVLGGAIFANVLISWSEFFGWTHWSDPAYYALTDPTYDHEPPGGAVFRMHITQGLLFSLLIAIAMAAALGTRRAIVQWGCWIVVAVTALDIGWVMIGRTGKAAVPLLACWAAFELLRQRGGVKRGWLAGLLLLLIIGASGLVVLEGHSRMGSILSEVHETHATGSLTSQGERVEFWSKGLRLMASRPLTGYGTGSVHHETARLGLTATTPVGRLPAYNLHDEYLMWAAQFGVPGLLAILALFVLWWRAAGRVSSSEGLQIRGHWLVFAFGCLINAYLNDFTEGFALVLMVALFVPLARFSGRPNRPAPAS